MDLQGTKEARTQEEGADGPLDAYGASSGRSKEFRKNERRDSHGHENSSTVNTLRRHQPPFAYPPGTRQPGAASRSGSGSTSSAAPRPRDPSPSPEAISIPQALGFGSRDQRLLCKARRQPPVTKRTLSELDLPCIMSNINLRMDANFDRDLHFKPDLDGEKGKRKRKEAADYWDSMAMEIAIYAYRAANPDDDVDEKSSRDSNSKRTFEPRLPTMFETLQEVIKTLVPERDHPSVMQNLEVPLLMQQVRKGVLDMVALATWMAALLKTHCAPMRDEWADRMVEQITEGSQSQEPKEIVNGLQTLFAILEAMKLVRKTHINSNHLPLSTTNKTSRTSRIIKYARSEFFSSKTRSHFCKSTLKINSAAVVSKLSPPDSGTLQQGNRLERKMKQRAQTQPSRTMLSSLLKPCSGEYQTTFSSSTHRRNTQRLSSLTRTGCGNCARQFKT